MYAYSFDEEHFYGEYETIEEALKEARESNNDKHEFVFIGKYGEFYWLKKWNLKASWNPIENVKRYALRSDK